MKTLVLKLILLTLALSPLEAAFAQGKVTPAPTSDAIITDVQNAQSVFDVVAALEKIPLQKVGPFYDSKMERALSREERVMIFNKIPSDILDINERLTEALKFVKTAGDDVTASELIYLTALDAKLVSAKSWLPGARYRKQRVLKTLFHEALDSWLTSIESGVASTLEPGRTQETERRAHEEIVRERLLDLGQAMAIGLTPEEVASLTKRYNEWYQDYAAKRKQALAVAEWYSKSSNVNRRPFVPGGDGSLRDVVELGVPMSFGLTGTMFTIADVLVSGSPEPMHLLSAVLGSAISISVIRREFIAGKMRRSGNPGLTVDETRLIFSSRESALNTLFMQIPDLPEPVMRKIECGISATAPIQN